MATSRRSQTVGTVNFPATGRPIRPAKAQPETAVATLRPSRSLDHAHLCGFGRSVTQGDPKSGLVTHGWECRRPWKLNFAANGVRVSPSRHAAAPEASDDCSKTSR